MNILITCGLIILFIIIICIVAEDMAIRVTALKYNEDPKELRKKYKKWREEKKRK